MLMNLQWLGPGRCYPLPTSDVVCANTTLAAQMDNNYPLKFKQKGTSTVYAGKAQNMSGQRWENVHAGCKSAALPD